MNARAEQLPSGPGTFTVATFGNSFHWMDREQVAATVHDLLRPGGAAVHLADWKAEPRTANREPPSAFRTRRCRRTPSTPWSAPTWSAPTWAPSDAPGAACCRTERPPSRPTCAGCSARRPRRASSPSGCRAPRR
ncbi:class I SAM-dependent methyltransferase [Kitasatospora griseola]|uniref:class I SAM-dependent methyltransferase n=1 Tax=Kitasatospora griseola TaxID=2064 RepID=UPI002E116E0F